MKSGEGRHTFQGRGLLPERGPMKEAKDSGAWSWNAQVLEPEAEAEKSLRGRGAPRRKARRYCAPSKAPALRWAPGCPLEPQTQGHDKVMWQVGIAEMEGPGPVPSLALCPPQGSTEPEKKQWTETNVITCHL